VAGYYFDEQDRYRDRPLSFHWHVPDLSREFDLPPARNVSVEVVRSSILAEAILAGEAGQGVSYSRNRNFYADGKRYRGTDFTYASVLGAVAELDKAGWISDRRVAPGNLGWQSSFVATDRLMQVWDAVGGELIYKPNGEIIWLKNDAGELIDYRETRVTLRLRRPLEIINKGLACLDIDVPGAERRGHLLVIEGGYVSPTPGNALRRIFNRSDFALGGRAYGWWQNIPKTVRGSLTIGGEPTAEVDYSAMHPAILYGRAGIKFTGDPDEISGFDRDEIKLGFNIALNAKNRRAAVAALADHLGTGRTRAAEIIGAIMERHQPIAPHFCSDAGVRLMRTDSEVILSATQAVNDAGAPALPIHDALIVPARSADLAAAKMSESFERIVGRVNPCSIKIKGGNVLHMGESAPGPAAPPPFQTAA
jgi:hypothetical protein